MGKRFNNEKKTYEFLIKWKVNLLVEICCRFRFVFSNFLTQMSFFRFSSKRFRNKNQNWADKYNSWEPAENLNCPHFIDAFEKKAESDRKSAHLQKFGFHRDKDTGKPLLGFEHGQRIETIVGAKFENEALWVLALW